MNVYLCKMTKSLLRKFFQDFANDPDIFSDMGRFSEFTYREADADARWERQQQLGRIHLAVMLEQEPIGEVILKDIDTEKRRCTLSIHMKNDSVKNRGFGTRAEILALEYAFSVLGMETVFADAIQQMPFIRTSAASTFWKRSDFRRPAAMSSSYITGMIKKYGIGIRRITRIRYARRRRLNNTVYYSTNAL